jgi:hypothetical protein
MTLNTDHKALAELGKEHAVPMLEVLYARGWLTASEASRELAIHISTAQSYLESLANLKLIQSRFRPGRANLVEYALIDKQINVNVDLDNILSERVNIALSRAPSLFIKEKANASVSYEWDESKMVILAINFMEKSKGFGRMGVGRSLKLTYAEGKFLWFLPQATEKEKSVQQIANEAGLTNPTDLIKILELVEMLALEKIIIVKERGV